ncbi:hypothetical protein [Thalassobacillus hwangdonensis]|uniref:CAP-associated domain-containing protein n=1 Tax=Thalassobacillus hwangdonensis TaxID=546108 RepID=A0ABW3KXZ5_9BACI
MKKYVWIGITLAGIWMLFVYFTAAPNVENVIKYFPLDTSKTFTDAKTTLSFHDQKDTDEYEVDWETTSTSSEPMYLRQDLSLLYVNGQLRGILNKWKEDGQTIEQVTSIHGEDSSLYQAITFHHGEVHYPEDVIKSIQKTSYDQLYVIDSPHTPLESFKQPDNAQQKEWVDKLQHSLNQQLDYQWDDLLLHFNIDVDNYVAVPLTDIQKFENTAIPGVSQQETSRILGQLWEGLYKNYVLGIADAKNSGHPIQSYIPLVLFDKNGTHLMVLFEDDKGNKEQLIQRY